MADDGKATPATPDQEQGSETVTADAVQDDSTLSDEQLDQVSGGGGGARRAAYC